MVSFKTLLVFSLTVLAPTVVTAHPSVHGGNNNHLATRSVAALKTALNKAETDILRAIDYNSKVRTSLVSVLLELGATNDTLYDFRNANNNVRSPSPDTNTCPTLIQNLTSPIQPDFRRLTKEALANKDVYVKNHLQGYQANFYGNITIALDSFFQGLCVACPSKTTNPTCAELRKLLVGDANAAYKAWKAL